MTITFDDPCPNGPFKLHPVKKRASRRTAPNCSATPKTDAILFPLLLMLQAATSNNDCKSATINTVRHVVTHAKAMETEATRLRQAIADTLKENGHLADGDVCTLKKLKDALMPNAHPTTSGQSAGSVTTNAHSNGGETLWQSRRPAC